MASDPSPAVEWHLRHRAAERSYVRQADAVVELLPPGPVLDLGCGTAPLVEFLDPDRNPWTGIERDDGMAAGAVRRREPAAGRAVVADALTVPFRARIFAATVALGLFEYLARPETVMREAARVTRPDGVVLLTVPRRDSVYRRGLAATAPMLRSADRPDPFDLVSGRPVTPAIAAQWGRSAGLCLAVARPIAPALIPWPLDRFVPGLVRRLEDVLPSTLGTVWLFGFACPARRLGRQWRS